MPTPEQMSTPHSGIGAAFSDPILSTQVVFRAVLAAFSEPGTVHSLHERLIEPKGFAPTTARLMLTLADFETPVWLAPDLPETCQAWVRFHTGAPFSETAEAAKFAVLDGAGAAPPIAAFDPGEERYPDKSATLIVQVVSLSGGMPVRLSGPGIDGTRTIAPQGLREGFWDEVAANNARYPIGVDILLVSGDALIGLPRSTAIAISTGGL
ncbi:MAG: phosphonate C-P lyase system protein PhnH [Hyphomicrobiaceae bacterium]